MNRKKQPKGFKFDVPADDPILVDMEGTSTSGGDANELPAETLAALDQELQQEKQKKRREQETTEIHKHHKKLLRERAKAARNTTPYPNAQRIGPFEIVKIKEENTAISPSSRGVEGSGAAKFLNHSLYGSHVPRLPAHLVVSHKGRQKANGNTALISAAMRHGVKARGKQLKAVQQSLFKP